MYTPSIIQPIINGKDFYEALHHRIFCDEYKSQDPQNC